MKIKTSELTGLALDWAVAKALGLLEPIHNEPAARVVFYSDQWQKYMRLNPPPQVYYSDRYEPSTDCSQGGPIIGRIKGFEFKHWLEAKPESCCEAHIHNYEGDWIQFGPTPLIAALRCFVTSRLGDEVEIPEELL